jgi:hypothetical protein
MKPTRELKESAIRRTGSFRNLILTDSGDKNDEIDDGSSDGDRRNSRDDVVDEVERKKR